MPYDVELLGELDPPVTICGPACACASCSSATTIEGGWLPTIVWPSDVEAQKRRIDPEMKATYATVQGCAGLSAQEQDAFDEFYLSWQVFRAEEVPTFGAANKYDEALAYEKRLSEWQDVIGEKCHLAAPKVRPQEGPDTSIVKWIAAAAVVLGVAYLASPIVAGLRAKKR